MALVSFISIRNTTSASYCLCQQITALHIVCLKCTCFCMIKVEETFVYSKQWTLYVWHPSVSLTHCPSQQQSPLHTSLAVAVRPGLIQPISSERDSSEGTCCVSCCRVSKCQWPQSMAAIRREEGEQAGDMSSHRNMSSYH